MKRTPLKSCLSSSCRRCAGVPLPAQCAKTLSKGYFPQACMYAENMLSLQAHTVKHLWHLGPCEHKMCIERREQK
jgi:hypothetical protein